MQCDHMPLRQAQGAVLEWPQNFHYVFQHGPFILSCEKRPVLTVFWILNALAGEFW